MEKRDTICIAAELEALHGSGSKPWRKGWGPTTGGAEGEAEAALRLVTVSVEEAGHNSEACFCTGKMRKADRT